MDKKRELKVAIFGVGGFAARHHEAIQILEREGICRLIATCDPSQERLDEATAQFDFAERHVQQFHDYRDLLEACGAELDLVTIPTPVPLHAPMHRASLDAGVACYLEKPPTLDPAELEAMIERDQQAPHRTQVGFNFIVEPERQSLKRRLVAGDFGKLRQVRVMGLWPRDTSYYQRADWAGRLWKDDRLVLDSIFGNAMAHYIHNLLFWAGTGALLEWATVEEMQSELYRAHDIEGPDTIFAVAQLRGSGGDVAEARVAMTHACLGAHRHYEELSCEKATLRYHAGKGYSIQWPDMREEEVIEPRNLLVENFRQYMAYLKGEVDRPLTRLEDSRPFVTFNGLAYISSGIIGNVSDDHVRRETNSDTGAIGKEILGIEEIFERFFATGETPSAQGLPGSHAGNAVTSLENLVPIIQHIVQTNILS